jgi:hypothetical protein
VKKLTMRSASCTGHVRRTMASEVRTAIAIHHRIADPNTNAHPAGGRMRVS